MSENFAFVRELFKVPVVTHAVFTDTQQLCTKVHVHADKTQTKHPSLVSVSVRGPKINGDTGSMEDNEELTWFLIICFNYSMTYN